MYAQQKQMYDSHTHTCENRIVSLEQPHVRPIQRGKRPNPTEFGQKLHLSVVDGFTFLELTCWSNFNEGCDLTAVVEDYRRKFDCYPEAVLADKIYQTRANRAFCKERGIRLTGPALGRPKTGETDRKQKRQMYKDACDRNAVEGRNGNAKRRFGFDCCQTGLNRQDRSSPDPLSHECRPRSGKVAFALFSEIAFVVDFVAARGNYLYFSVGPNLMTLAHTLVCALVSQ